MRVVYYIWRTQCARQNESGPFGEHSFRSEPARRVCAIKRKKTNDCNFPRHTSSSSSSRPRRVSAAKPQTIRSLFRERFDRAHRLPFSPLAASTCVEVSAHCFRHRNRDMCGEYATARYPALSSLSAKSTIGGMAVAVPPVF